MPIKAPKGFIDETDPRVCQIGHPAPPWLVNYADLMTELVCFFVILYALSAALNKNVQNAAKQVQEMLDKGELKGEVKVDREGLKISLEEQGQMSFFDSGSADTTPAMETMVGKIVPVLRKLAEKQDVIVEGHSDNLPIRNEYFDSNWELSTARATSVARMLIDKYELPPGHVGAIGYGEFRPVVPNDTPENRAKNRRVVFFVKNAPFESKSPPGKGSAK
ncbi:MAG: flagellar motor protein MotB [Elusimicrobiota bacterium]|jgi:chemotaxis protein MotB